MKPPCSGPQISIWGRQWHRRLMGTEDSWCVLNGVERQVHGLSAWQKAEPGKPEKRQAWIAGTRRSPGRTRQRHETKYHSIVRFPVEDGSRGADQSLLQQPGTDQNAQSEWRQDVAHLAARSPGRHQALGLVPSTSNGGVYL